MEQLRKEYLDDNKSREEIAMEHDTSLECVKNKLRKYGIKKPVDYRSSQFHLDTVVVKAFFQQGKP